jgi:MOSC domain-containing protein YiiM
MINVTKVYYKDKLSNKSSEKKVQLIAGYGIQGDIHGGKSGRHVSIMFESTKTKVDSMSIKGLCTAKFKENLTLSGSSELKIGDIVKIQDSEIKITQVGKRCFSECELFQNGIECYLSEVAFGEVLVSGEVKVGDEVVLKNDR